jgi:hypothetical protein
MQRDEPTLYKAASLCAGGDGVSTCGKGAGHRNIGSSVVIMREYFVEDTHTYGGEVHIGFWWGM